MKTYKSQQSNTEKLLKEIEEENINADVYKNVSIICEKKNNKTVEQIIDYINNQFPDRLLSISLDEDKLELVWDRCKPKSFGNNAITQIENITGSKISVTNQKLNQKKALKQL